MELTTSKDNSNWEDNRNRDWKEELEELLSKDPLAELVAKDYTILSNDILNLDSAKLYSTKSVVEILSKYPYLYDADKGENYVNENRVRWWLNEKDEDNLLFYLQIKRPSRNWVWDVPAIVRAKIVAILRFAQNYQQKYIKARATGLMIDSPKMSEENITSLVETGTLNQVRDVETLKNMVLLTIRHFDKKHDKLRDDYAELYGELEAVLEDKELIKTQLENVITENDKLKTRLFGEDGIESRVDGLQSLTGNVLENSEEIKTLQKNSEEINSQFFGEGGWQKKVAELKSIQDKISQIEQQTTEQVERGVNTLQAIDTRRRLRIEALQSWERENGLFKRLFAKESEIEAYVEQYITEHNKKSHTE